jgi:phosphatidylglycerophosphate synthase
MQSIPSLAGRSAPAAWSTDRDSLAWPPNLLTLLRLPLAALVWWSPGSVALLLTCMALAAASDWADGWLARTYTGGDQPGNLGAWLDPACDKVFVASAAAVVLFSSGASLALVGLLMLRELALVPLLAWYRLTQASSKSFDFRAGLLGKATTVAQFIAIGLLAVGSPAAVVLCVVSAATGAGATAVYIVRATRNARR